MESNEQGFQASPSEEGRLDRWRKLYPDATEDELRQADENMRRYFNAALKIFLRLKRDGKPDEVLNKDLSRRSF